MRAIPSEPWPAPRLAISSIKDTVQSILRWYYLDFYLAFFTPYVQNSVSEAKLVFFPDMEIDSGKAEIQVEITVSIQVRAQRL